MKLPETRRLCLRRFSQNDAPFILSLLNDDSLLHFIGDKGVKSLADARDYLVHGPLASYERHGFGLYLVTLKQGGGPIGICGLLKRDALDDVDLGFAFMTQYTGQGYGTEAATAVLAYGQTVLGLKRIVAVTRADNIRAIHVLKKLGLQYEGMVRLAAGEEESMLFGVGKMQQPGA